MTRVSLKMTFQVTFNVAGLLVLPLTLLLFAQWPLRDLVQAGSRLANDVAQVVFALYVAVAVTAATVAGTHLAGGLGQSAIHESGSAWHHVPGWRAWVLAACVVPWSLFLLWAAAPQIVDSVTRLEKFGDTLSPGFFGIKVALGLMLLLVLIQALSALRGKPSDPPATETSPTKAPP